MASTPFDFNKHSNPLHSRIDKALTESAPDDASNLELMRLAVSETAGRFTEKVSKDSIVWSLARYPIELRYNKLTQKFDTVAVKVDTADVFTVDDLRDVDRTIEIYQVARSLTSQLRSQYK